MPENAVENPVSSQYVPSSNLVTDSIIASETYLISGDGIITGVAEGTEVSTLTGGIKVVMEGGVMHLFDASGNEKTSGKSGDGRSPPGVEFQWKPTKGVWNRHLWGC